MSRQRGVAGEIAAGHGHVHPGPTHDRARRPPLYPWLLSRFLSPTWNASETDALREIHGLLWVQTILGTLLVLATFLLGRALFDERVALLAGALAAVEPTFVAYSHYFWCETLFTVLILCGLLGVVLGTRSRSWLVAILAGLAFGAAALTRELALPIAAVCVLWQIYVAPSGSRRAALLRGAATLGLTVAVVLPWTWRNYALFHRLVPISTSGWAASAEGNTLDPEDWFRKPPDVTRMKAEISRGRDEMERDDIAHRYALDRISAEQPTWIGKKLARNTALLLSPDSNLLMKLREGRYGPVSIAWKRFLEATSVLAFVLVFVLACLGIASESRPGARALPCAILGTVIAVHVLSIALTRYRFPWMPLLIVYASAAALDVPAAIRRTSPRAKAALAAILISFFAFCVPYHRELLAQLWNGDGQNRARHLDEGGTESIEASPVER
jgi:4-amino-4-deoxy-L-arabinose transferase-like glycosyltransferase